MTILDCIERIPSVLQGILDSYPQNIDPVLDALGEALGEIDELIFVGSGTSDTSSRTSRPSVMRYSGLRTTVLWPAELERILELPSRKGDTNGLNPHGLYIFTSQTGTSKLTSAMMRRVEEAGCRAMSITESVETPLAKTSRLHILMGCGREEFLMRTIGYVSSVLTHVLLAIRIGVRRGVISSEEERELLEKAGRAARNRQSVQETVKAAFPKIAGQMLESAEVIFTGQGAMYGVALEGVVKFWEMPQKPSIGLELEEGMHGPNYGYGHSQYVVYLCDGSEIDPGKGLSLIRYMRDIHDSSLAVGDVPEELGIRLELSGPEFSFIEMSAVVQLMAYLLTMEKGRDVSRLIDHSDMDAYFTTHQKSSEGKP